MSDTEIPAGHPRPNENKEQRARRLLVNALEECGDLAYGVEHFQGEELFDVLTYLDSLRLIMIENQNILIGLVRGDEGSPPVPRKYRPDASESDQTSSE